MLPKEERTYETPEAHEVLEPPSGYRRAPQTCRCSNPSCKAFVQSSDKFCSRCAAPNKNYSSIADAVDRGGRAQGYKRPQPLVDMGSALDFSPRKKLNTTKIWGDIIAKTRSRSSEAAPKTEEAPAEPPFAEEAEQAHPEQSEGEEEMDLDTVEGVVACISELFLESDLKAVSGSLTEFDKIATIFAKWLLQKKPKGTPLSKFFRADSLDRGDFANSKKRRAWYEHWRKEHRARFVKKSDLKKSDLANKM